MALAADLLIGLVAVLHLLFLWFEMFAWERRGPKVFRRFPPEYFARTRVLAANQGLYNGILAAGLIWSLLAGPSLSRPVAEFFLAAVVVAGVFGALTASRRIFYVQALPAVVALALVVLG